MKYAVSAEGISALKYVVNVYNNIIDIILSHGQELKAVAEITELGPHKDSVISASESIENSIKEVFVQVKEIVSILEEVIEGYEEITANDRFHFNSGALLSGHRVSSESSLETRFEKETTLGPETSGEKVIGSPSPYSDNWLQLSKEFGGEKNDWESLREVPFAGNGPIRITESMFNEVLNSIHDKRKLQRVRDLITSGNIIICNESAPDDSDPPHKVLTLKRRR